MAEHVEHRAVLQRAPMVQHAETVAGGGWASSRSWVTSTIGMRISRRSCASSSRSRRRVSWSTAEKGSSRSRTRGSRASARASATRCRCPPESSAGRRASSPSMLTRASSAAPARRAPRAGGGSWRRRRWPARRDAGTGRSAGTPGRPPPLRRDEGASRVSSQVSPSQATSPSGGDASPAMQRSTVVLPLPDGPASARSSRRRIRTRPSSATGRSGAAGPAGPLKP